MSDPTNVVNPGLVNVADEAYDGFPVDFRASNGVNQPVSISPNNKVKTDGNERPFVVDQEIIVGPSQSAGPVVNGGASSAKLTSVDQEILVGPSQNDGKHVRGGEFSPTSPNVINTTANNVVGQTYGNGQVKNVNV